MLQKIAVLTDYNLYESKRYFAQRFVEALHRKGIDAKIIDLEHYERVGPFMDDIVKFSPDLTCSLHNIPRLFDGRYLWEWLRIPHLAMLLDPSLYYLDIAKSPFCLTSCIDRYDCAFLKSLSFENTFFLPLAVEKDLHEDPRKERPFDVVFLGSCNDYEGARSEWQANYSAAVSKVLDAAIDLVFSDKNIPLAQALITAIKEHSFSEQGITFERLFTYLDIYTRGRDRVEIIRAIKNPKTKIHVFGDLDTGRYISKNGWSYYLGAQSNVTLHPSVSFAETLQILKKSKISLNSMPFFKDGAHDRIFTSLACGALTVTSSSNYISECFKIGEELLTYYPKSWDKGNLLIEECLGDENLRREMVLKGQVNVMKHHTWDTRAEALLKSVPGLIEKVKNTSDVA